MSSSDGAAASTGANVGWLAAYDRRVHWWLAALGGAALGAALVGLAWLLWQRRASRRSSTSVEHLPVDPQVGRLIAVLRSGALIIGTHDEVVHSNTQARTWGLARADRIAVPEVLDRVRQARLQDAPLAEEITVRRGVGAPDLHLTVRIAPLDSGSMIVLADDRTPLIRVDETRRDFVTNVSHELKTPIGAISLLAEAVQQAADDPEAVQHFAERMSYESSRLTELVSQIIALSRLQADDPMLSARPLQISELTATAVERCTAVAAAKGITVMVAGQGHEVVLGDEVQLCEAVTNLLQNAIAYSDPGSRVVISQRRVSDADGDLAEISVADNGIGIRPEDQQRIFERFYRVDFGRSRENGGTGLGLSIVKHIAAVHGGSVDVWSRPHQGSTFSLRFPIHTERDEPSMDPGKVSA